MNCNLKEYKEFIDNEMLLILGQMDKASLIFDHLYLVRCHLAHLLKLLDTMFYCVKALRLGSLVLVSSVNVRCLTNVACEHLFFSEKRSIIQSG